MKKFFAIIATTLLCATSLMAQEENKGFSFAAEAGIGSEFEIGARAEYGLNKYLSWDALHVKYAYDWNQGGDWNELTLTTGLRGYTPTFGPGVKAFAALDLGYGLTFNGDWSNSNFALDFTIGIKYKNWYAGYGLGTLHNDGTHKDHLFRLGLNF